ncbi:NAD(P)H-dependent FMN reductase [Reichenbachiella faecimaris]|uniref:NAD(P)H-dependent FMN reductase n=1 Tax=Reichenbachiella faecimaris TaxID=692418 RepID=A0A1W2G9C8_REIFA|nr:NAD(P)H-dependent oxidoreductase [Reichenbachiella faecimaris]SMD33104.1 NAD(P)H-dependent FMN reductase [Reichenbachiella faecimaris]
MKKIIAFAGSNSSTSINIQLVKYAASLIDQAEVEFLDLRDYDAPIYSADIEKEGIPRPIQELVAKLAEADAYIIGSPEHNGSLTAFMKNTIDWASRVEAKFLGGKPVLLLSTSGGKRGAASSLEDLNIKMKYFAGQVAATYSLGAFYDRFDQEQGVITNDEERKKLTEATAQFEKTL